MSFASPDPTPDEPAGAAYPRALTVRDALEAYFRKHGFGREGYSARSFTLRLLGIPIKFPSTSARRRALPLHDLHHIATGYGTDWIGEAEIAAWELRGGCDSLFLYWINGSGLVIGTLLAPRRMWRAFQAARGQHTLYRDGLAYDLLLEMKVSELRTRLGIPEGGSPP